MAVEKKNLEIVQLLCSNLKIDMNIKSFIYQIINRPGYDEIKRHEKTSLHLAVEEDDIKIVQLMLQANNVDINLHSLFFHDKNNYANYFVHERYIWKNKFF